MADGKTRIYSLPEITNVDSDMYIMLDSGAVGTRRYNLKTMYDKIDGVDDAKDAAQEAADSATTAAANATSAAIAAASAATSAQSTVQSLVTNAQATMQGFMADATETMDGLVDDVNDALEAVGDISELAVPLMSPTTRGGAKLGHGLVVEDGALGIGSVTDATDAGPIVELTAKGWAEQDTTTGKNLTDINVFRNNTTDSKTFLQLAFQIYNGSTYIGAYHSWIEITSTGRVSVDFTVENSQYSYRLKHNGGSADIVISTDIFAGTKTQGAQYCLSFDVEGFNPTVVGGVSLKNFQLELGSTATSYEPYSGGAPSPSPSYPQEIKVCRGRNLLDTSGASSPYLQRNGDGSFTVSAQPSTAQYIVIGSVGLVGGATYTLSGGVSTSAYVTIASFGASNPTPKTFTETADQTENIAIVIQPTTPIGTTFYPQLERGSTAHPYAPYGCVGVDVGNKNLFSLQSSYTNDTSSAKYVLPDTGILAIEAGTYMLSFDSAQTSGSASVTFKYADGSGTSIQAITLNGGRATKQFNFGSQVNKVAIYLPANTTISNIQLELGTEATEYVPYYHTTIPVPLPSRGWVAALPDGTADTLTLDGAGGYVWTLNTRMTTQAVTDGVTGTVGVNVMSSTGQIADGATVLYKGMTTTESDYVDSMPTVPVHASISSADLVNLTVRCCADEGAAEIASAWGRKYESRIANLESIVAELIAGA